MDDEAKELLRVIRDTLLRKEEREAESARKMEEAMSKYQATDASILAAHRRNLRETRFALFGAFLTGLIIGYLGFLFAYRNSPPFPH